MMNIFPLILSLFISFHPSPTFNCGGDELHATIRNNLNGNFEITDNLENIDKGAFVVLDLARNTAYAASLFQSGGDYFY